MRRWARGYPRCFSGTASTERPSECRREGGAQEFLMLPDQHSGPRSSHGAPDASTDPASDCPRS